MARQVVVHDLAALLGDELHVLGSGGNGVVAAAHEVHRAALRAHDALQLGVEVVDSGEHESEVRDRAGGRLHLRARLERYGDRKGLGGSDGGLRRAIRVRDDHQVAVDVHRRVILVQPHELVSIAETPVSHVSARPWARSCARLSRPTPSAAS